MNNKKITLSSAILIALFGLTGCGQNVSSASSADNVLSVTNESKALTYPRTEKVAVIDDYFGTKVTDNYRWLEDDMSAETAEWVKAQNKTTHDYLAQIPYREKIKSRLAALLDYEKVGMPFIEGDYSYFYKNNGLQNQYVLYRQKGDAPAKVFLDPNTFNEDDLKKVKSFQNISPSQMADTQLFDFETLSIDRSKEKKEYEFNSEEISSTNIDIDEALVIQIANL